VYLFLLLTYLLVLVFVTRQTYFKFWFFSQLFWLLTIAVAILQSNYYELSNVLGSILLFFHCFFIYQAFSLLSNVGKKRELWFVVFLVIVLTIGLIIDLQDNLSIIRPILNSFALLVSSGLVALFIFSYSKTDTSSNQHKSLRFSLILLGSSYLVQAGYWIWRIIQVFGIEYRIDVFENTSLNNLALLFIPPIQIISQLVFMFFLILQIAKQKESFKEQFLTQEQSRVFSNLVWSLNHELNTPVGNAKLAVDILAKNKQIAQLENQTIDILSNSLQQISELITNRNSVMGDSSSVELDICQHS
jgi:signal transduction histidine kinase